MDSITGSEYRIGIIGAGFSGTLLAVHLLRQARRPTRVFLIERSGRFGAGLAYGTDDPGHLLNVRVGNMSAFPDDPSHFLRWSWARDDPTARANAIPPSGHAFVPRQLYAVYLHDVLAESLRTAPAGVQCETIAAEVVDLLPRQSGAALQLADGRTLAVDRAVLTIGNFPPALPPGCDPGLATDPRFIGDPWDLKAVRALPADAWVLILGTGLTMVDLAASLAASGHRGPIHALSRHGLLPQRHQEVRSYPYFPGDEALPATVAGLLRRLRQEVLRGAERGYPWRSVFDSLRPHIQSLWQGLNESERRRFLRHARPWWDSHRHRMAPATADRIQGLIKSDQLTVRAARLITLKRYEGRLEARFRRRDGTIGCLAADTVINCSGPSYDLSRSRLPLIGALFGRGLILPDELGLGLQVAPEGILIDAHGAAADCLYALGPITRGAYWEITAVPDIRSRCAELAATLTARAARPADGPGWFSYGI